ncbi:MAG: PilZ domain-containing protein [Treponema sp.]|jgi:hypothetical protein|nr:PilZ domain-containing protein [Treponema sp.]
MPLFDKRKNRRYPSVAKAQSSGVFSGDALLKDLSITGCCIECTMCPEISAGEKYKMSIFPEENSGIGSFELVVECKWIHTADYSCEIGFDIVQSPRGKTFQRYVDYLSWRSA